MEALENAKVVIQDFIYDLTHPVTAGQFMGNVVMLIVIFVVIFGLWKFLTQR